MRSRFKTLAWVAGLAVLVFFASSLPAHAQSCSTVCTSNTNCSTECNPSGSADCGEIPPNGKTPPACTTCGGAGEPCCTPTSTSTLFCTAQFLNVNDVCVQVEVNTVVTTCPASTSMVVNKQKGANATCATCPTEFTSGCEQYVSTSCPS